MKKLLTVLIVLLVATALFAGVTVKAGGTFGFDTYKSVSEFTKQSGLSWKIDNLLADKALVFKSKGFGFDVGVQYDITDKFLAYVDFNMLFPGDVKVNLPEYYMMKGFDELLTPEDVIKKYFEDEKFKTYSLKGLVADLNKYIKDKVENMKVSTKFSFFSVSAGVAYKLDFNAVKLAVGGGVTLNKASVKINFSCEIEDVAYVYEDLLSFTTIGVNLMVDAKYMVAQNVGVGVTLMPQIGLYNRADLSLYYHEGDLDPEKESDIASGFKISFAMPIVVGVSYTF